EQQREMWTAVLMSDEANCSYNQSFVLCLEGAVSHASLQRALEVVVERHEALRIRIDAESQQQEVAPAIEVRLPLVDLTPATPAERAAAIAAVNEEETHTPFDVEVAPLWRARLLKESADRYRFVFTAHHLIVDGWSSAVVFADLASAYSADRFGMQAA